VFSVLFVFIINQLLKCLKCVVATVFGELWKLQPLPEERKTKWRREMDWLLSPTNYMVELVPAKQNCANGRALEVPFVFVEI